MTAYYYINGSGGVGKEFVVFSDDNDADFSYDDFKLYKTYEVDLGDLERAIGYEAHYMKDT